MTKLLMCAAFLACVLVSGSVLAQTFDPRPGVYRTLTPVPRPVVIEEGLGFRFGGMVFHPGIALSGGYNSNVFYEAPKEGVDAAGMLEVMPTVRIDTPDPRRLRFTTNLQVRGKIYLSDDERVRAQNGLDVLGDAALQIGPRGLVSFTIYDVVRRNTDSPSQPSLRTRTHLYNEVGGVIEFHPGGADRTNRRGLTAELTAGYGIERWDESLQLDRNLFVSRLVAKYFFLPKTAALLHASYARVSYAVNDRTFEPPDDNPVWESYQDTLVNVDSTPFRLTAGLAGLITRAIDARVEGGWGWGFYDSAPTFSGFIGHVDVGFFATPNVHLRGGWDRNFYDSTFSNFYLMDRFFADLEVTSGDWFVGFRAAYDIQRFSYLAAPSVSIGGVTVPLYSATDREDPLLTGHVFVSWNYRDWGRLVSFYMFRANMSDFTMITPSTIGALPIESFASYAVHMISLAAEFEY